MRRLSRVVRAQGGTSIVEMVIVMLILSTVLGALTTAFVEGTRSELDSNNRVRAQIDAGVALDRLRKDVHCASAITPVGSSSSITLTVPSGCPTTGLTTIYWCVLGSGTRYTLYRDTISCTASSKPYADYLTSASVFNYTAPVSATSLGTLNVDLRINVRPATSTDLFELRDNIVLRNTTRS
jgi:type II secretory pathway pseudopilin PulG